MSQYQQCNHLKGNKKINSNYVVSETGDEQKNTIGGLTDSTLIRLPKSTQNDYEMLIFFGREDSTSSSDKVWKYSTNLNQWIFLRGRNTTNQGPKNIFSTGNEQIGCRYSVKGWINEIDGHNIISLFGGTAQILQYENYDTNELDEINSKSIYYSNEFWRYNVTSNSFSVVHYNYVDKTISLTRPATNVFSTSTMPGGRKHHEIIQMNEENIVLFGGKGYLVSSFSYSIFPLGDWWIYSSTTLNWTLGKLSTISNFQISMVYGETNVYSSENEIGSIYEHSGVKINEEEALIFGGSTAQGKSNCVHKYNITSNFWKYVSGNYSTLAEAKGYGRSFDENNFPSYRTNHKIWKVSDDEVLLFAGYLDSINLFNDEWRFNTKSNLWKFSGLESTKYTNRYILDTIDGYELLGGMELFVGSFIEETNSLYIIGGRGYDYHTAGFLNDVFRIYLGSKCQSIEAIDPLVCSGKGKCQSHETCECQSGYYGVNCEISQCSGILSNESNVCFKNGQCIDGVCQCETTSFYVNDDCSFNSELKALNDYFWVFVLIPIAVIFVLCIFFIIILFLLFLSTKLKTDLKKFNEIEDIDLVLEEQKFSKDSSIAHLNINKSLFEIDVKDIIVLEKIGQGGGSAVVYSALWNKQKVAYKCFAVNDFLDNEKYKEFEKEVEILASVNFPYILTFYGATMNLQRLGFIIEFAENGDLDQFLKSRKDYPLKERFRMLYEISSSMLYLHNNDIIHRDLKLQNILVTGKEETKLMDFGLSKVLETSEKTKTRRVGTSFFIAPEVITGQYGKPCDVYSFAVLMFIVLSGNFLPFGNKPTSFISGSKIKKSTPDLKIFEELSIPKKYIDVIEKNWNHEPSKRMNFEEITEVLQNYSEEISIPVKIKDYKIDENAQKINKKLRLKIKSLEKRIRKLEKELAKK